jgi:integrase
MTGFDKGNSRQNGDGRKKGNTGAVDSGSDRKHLTSRQVERLIEAAKGSRNEARARCLLLLMFRHGFRVSEACRLKLDQRRSIVDQSLRGLLICAAISVAAYGQNPGQRSRIRCAMDENCRAGTRARAAVFAG